MGLKYTRPFNTSAYLNSELPSNTWSDWEQSRTPGLDSHGAATTIIMTPTTFTGPHDTPCREQQKHSAAKRQHKYNTCPVEFHSQCPLGNFNKHMFHVSNSRSAYTDPPPASFMPAPPAPSLLQSSPQHQISQSPQVSTGPFGLYHNHRPHKHQFSGREPAGSLPLETVRRLTMEFQSITNGSKYIDFNSFRVLFLSAMCEIEHHKLDNLARQTFKQMDVNGDGVVDFSEFVSGYKMLQGQQNELEDDDDGDGCSAAPPSTARQSHQRRKRGSPGRRQ